MLINFTNHPSDKWPEKQYKAARETYGTILDYKFPNVPPEADSEDIMQLADKYFQMITVAFDSCASEPFENAVHIQGEFTLVYRLVNLLRSSGIRCIASTTKRIVKEHDDGTRTYQFEFVRFREYV